MGKILVLEKLDDIIFYTLDKSIRTYRMYAQKRLREFGFEITIDQWLVLKALTENPGILQQEIAAKVFKDNASVTRIIELLAKADYLERKINPDDRRRSNLKVTSKGKKLISDIQNLIVENRANALQGISHSELETIQRVLLKITENCQEEV